MCACVDADAYMCWAMRYGRHPEPEDAMEFIARVEADGGPCQCWCHDEDEEEETGQGEW